MEFLHAIFGFHPDVIWSDVILVCNYFLEPCFYFFRSWWLCSLLGSVHWICRRLLSWFELWLNVLLRRNSSLGKNIAFFIHTLFGDMIRPNFFLFLIKFSIKGFSFIVILLEPIDSFLHIDCIVDGWCSNLRERETFLWVTFSNHRFKVNRRWKKPSTNLLFDRPVILNKWISALYWRN